MNLQFITRKLSTNFVIGVTILFSFIGNIFWNIEIINTSILHDVYSSINLIIISLITTGFALTYWGLLIALSQTELISKLQGTKLLQKRYDTLYNTIKYNCTAATISLFLILKAATFEILINEHKLTYFLLLCYFVFMIAGVVYFFKSICQMTILLKASTNRMQSFPDDDYEAFVKDVERMINDK